MDIHTEQQLEILGRRFEERPLVTFEIHSYEMPERGDRFVAARVQELDDDVGVAVGLEVGPTLTVQKMLTVVRRILTGEARRPRRRRRQR